MGEYFQLRRNGALLSLNYDICLGAEAGREPDHGTGCLDLRGHDQPEPHLPRQQQDPGRGGGHFCEPVSYHGKSNVLS